MKPIIKILERDNEYVVQFTIWVQTFSLYPVYKDLESKEWEALSSAEFSKEMLRRAFKNLFNK